jgi:hypothetical protein
MECHEIPADETFENRDLAFITHWHLATEHFEKPFYATSWVLFVEFVIAYGSKMI